jgi:hypothetical protein
MTRRSSARRHSLLRFKRARYPCASAGGCAENVAWTRELSAAMKPFTSGRVYFNFIGDEGEDRVVAAFGRPPDSSLPVSCR